MRADEEALFCDKSSGRTLTGIAVTLHLAAEALASGVVDRLIKFTVFARWHEPTSKLVG